MALRGRYVVVGRDKQGNMIELYRTDLLEYEESERRVAREVAKGIRNCGIEASVFPISKVADVNPKKAS